MMGHNGYGHAELFFENCRLGEDQILGELGEGFKLIMKTVSRVRLANIGARAVGMAQRAFDMAVKYANERQQFGAPIGSFQMVQKMIADMATDIYATRLMVLNTAWELDQGRDPRDKISMVKLHASEMVGRVTDQALQIFGGMGYTKDLPIERLYRDCRVMRIFDGTSEIHRTLIAKHALKEAAAA
jgi:acyl-CoA dehydrogenase